MIGGGTVPGGAAPGTPGSSGTTPTPTYDRGRAEDLAGQGNSQNRQKGKSKGSAWIQAGQDIGPAITGKPNPTGYQHDVLDVSGDPQYKDESTPPGGGQGETQEDSPGHPQVPGLIDEVDTGSDWEPGRTPPQVPHHRAGPGRQVGTHQIQRGGVRNVQAQVPHVDMMLGMIQDQGSIPQLFDPDRQVDLERPYRIDVDQIEHRDIDYTPDERLLDSLIGERTRYTEMQLREQRDEAMEAYKADMASRGISGGAGFMAAQRDVAKPYNDRIAANRQQVVDQAITQFEDLRLAVAVRNRQNEIEVAKQNQQISLEQEVRNVGFLVQTVIAEGDINARLGGQLAVAAIQAETARRGQSLGALASLQGLQTTTALEAALANQQADLGILRANQQAGLESDRLNQQDLTQRDLADQRAGLEADRINAQNWLQVLGLDAEMVRADMQNNLQLLELLMQDENVDSALALDAWKAFQTLHLNTLAITADIGRTDIAQDETR